MSRLLEFRKKLKVKSQEEMAKMLGVSARNYGYYENGRQVPSEVQERLAQLGLNLNWLSTGEGSMILPVKEVKPGHIGGSDFSLSLEERITTPNPAPILPEHVQEAYKIVFDAVQLAKADFMGIDSEKAGLVIGLIAAEMSRGNKAEARMQLTRRAEVLLGLKKPPP